MVYDGNPLSLLAWKKISCLYPETGEWLDFCSTTSSTSRSTNWGEVGSNDYEGKDRSGQILGDIAGFVVQAGFISCRHIVPGTGSCFFFFVCFYGEDENQPTRTTKKRKEPPKKPTS